MLKESKFGIDKMTTLLWLDDLRDPLRDTHWVEDFSPITPDAVIWVKTVERFASYINTYGLPDAICFDHDLGEDEAKENVTNGMNKKAARAKKKLAKSGMDAAKWLIDFCIDNDKDLPLWNIQSANPVGKENINGILTSYKKHRL